jgi:hypothetical protein
MQCGKGVRDRAALAVRFRPGMERRVSWRLREGEPVTAAGDALKATNRPAVHQLPMDCPYCQEVLEDAPRGWVCCRCRSTVGTEPRVE